MRRVRNLGRPGELTPTAIPSRVRPREEIPLCRGFAVPSLINERKGVTQVRSKRSRLAVFGVLALALSVTVGITAGSTHAAKKKKVKTFSQQISPNAAIPD